MPAQFGMGTPWLGGEEQLTPKSSEQVFPSQGILSISLANLPERALNLVLLSLLSIIYVLEF